MSTFILNHDIDVANMTIQDIAKHYESEVNRYREHIKTFGDDLESLREEEKFVMGLMEADEARMAKFKGYELPESVEFLGEKLTKGVIATKIRKIFERCEVPFSYTLGYLQVYTFWQQPTKYIEHKMLDSTTRILGDPKLTFKGPKEWASVLAIDSYLQPMIKDFNLNKIYQVLGIELHNVVLDAMKINDVIEEDKE